MTRAERVARAQQLRADGLLIREIAEQMGISKSYASDLISDPDSAKLTARRDTYRRPCSSCGKLMYGSDGLGPRAPEHCAACVGEARQIWTKEKIIVAIREFADRYGRPPSAWDWNPHMALNGGTVSVYDRFYTDGCWPYTHYVQERFGSWNAGIAAAGFTPRRPGQRGPGRKIAA
jgi:hypothetical protein